MIVFINISCYILAFGVISIVYVLPNYGFYTKEESAVRKNNIVFPYNILTVHVSYVCMRILSYIIFSRFEIIKSIFR
jgi:hypothetical protein